MANDFTEGEVWRCCHEAFVYVAAAQRAIPSIASPPIKVMIFTQDDSKQPADQKVQREDLPASPEEPPPSYSVRTESVAGGSTSATAAPSFKTKPTNFLALSTGDSIIRGEFVIDPSLSIPPAMLPPLGEGETEDDRKNLSLSSKHSSVNAEIWLLGPSGGESTPEDPPRQRTTLALNSDHGSIRAELHALDGAAPFSLTARAPHGSVRLAIPHSFEGLLSLSTRDGSVSVSDPIVRNATQLSQLGDARRYFVGDFSKLGEDEWQGDRVEIDTRHGSIRLKYVDEVAESHGKKGLFSRLFGK